MGEDTGMAYLTVSLQLFLEMPNHPGLAHYIIHSYDVPLLAERAVEAAHRYLDIAASMPHALHMSGHIFTQMGMWVDSINANTRSAKAARERGERFGVREQAQVNELHALNYLVYAYLQRGQDEDAGRVVEDIESRNDLNWRNSVVSFNAGAAPAIPLKTTLTAKIAATRTDNAGSSWAKSSSGGESHPSALTDPDVNLSAHTALIVQPMAE